MDSSNGSPKRMIVAASVSVVAAATAALYYTYVNSNSTSKKKSSSKAAAPAASESSSPSLPAETTSKILEEIIISMSNVMMQLAKIEQKVREESASAGTPLPEEQLAQYLAQNFEESLKQVSTSVYAKYNASEDVVQEACEFYMENDASVHNQMVKLQQMIQVATGQPLGATSAEANLTMAADGSVPADIELPKLLNIVEETFEKMATIMEEVCTALVEEKIPKESVTQELQMRYSKAADAATLEIFESHGVSRESFHNSTIKYGQDPEFLQKMQAFQETQGVRFKTATDMLGLDA